jgi:hypothetical protein
MTQATICSSSASTASLVNPGDVGSIHTDRPSELRRTELPAGSRSTHCSTTRSAARSNTRSHRPAGIPAIGRRRSHKARSTSARHHVEAPAEMLSIISATVTFGDCSLAWSRLDASIAPVSRSAVQPAASASVRHRAARSATPTPDFLRRVSFAASRSNAACSNRDGARPSRSTNPATLSASARSISALRLENRRSNSGVTPSISACPFTISPQATPNRSVSSVRSSDWYKPPNIRCCRFK